LAEAAIPTETPVNQGLGPQDSEKSRRVTADKWRQIPKGFMPEYLLGDRYFSDP